jgi:hypothetical protein
VARPTVQLAIVKWTFRRPGLAATLYVSELLAGLLVTALAVRPYATLELLRGVWFENLFRGLLVGAVAATAAVLMIGVQAYRDRVGWGHFLVQVAWMVPTLVAFMAIFLMALRLFMMIASSGSFVLMAAAGVGGVALLRAAWRYRGVRAYLQVLRARPRAWWLRMLVVVCCAQAVALAVYVWALKSGGFGAR